LKAVPAPVDALVALASDSQTADRTKAILTGMSEALRGWRQAPIPKKWDALQQSALVKTDTDIERLVRDLSVVFGDGRALDSLLAIAADHDADPAARRDALRVLVEARATALVPLLLKMADERNLGADAVRAMAAFDDASIPGFLLTSYGNLKEPAREATIITLASRPAWARQLLTAVAAGVIDRGQVPAFQVRQMAAFPDETVRGQVNALWPELRSVPEAKKQRIAQLKASLPAADLATADLSQGRARFVKACATCHMLFGQGAKIGPDLTGAQRVNLDYLLENIVDPAATVTPVYRLSNVALADGRLLSGIVSDQAGETIAIQTPTERIVVSRKDVDEVHPSTQSLMPEGVLDTLTPEQQRDLIAYLMSPQQVPLPAPAGD
jgi:putative heme-binding domain-containing protein